MKKIFTTLILMTAIFGSVSAQSVWTSHGDVNKALAPQTATRAGVSEIELGYCSTDAVIWPYDGLSLSYDARVGVGAIFTKDMFAKYAGAKIVGMWVGWDDELSESTYDCFIRNNSFGGTTIAEASSEVSFGWNYVAFDEIELTADYESLAIGFYTDLVKDVCSIPKIYPANVANSAYLFHGELDNDGKEKWYDARDFGIMPIVLVLKDTDGRFHNMMTIDNIKYDGIVRTGEMIDCIYKISNVGTNEISNIELTTVLGEESHSEIIDFSTPIPAQRGGQIILPVKCIGTGKHLVTVTAINGMIPTSTNEYSVNLIGVPTEVANSYDFRPVVEYFVSEDNYMTAQYVDDFFYPDFERYADRMTLVMPHVEDKFMTNEYSDDDALNALITLAGGDKMKVYLPSMTINRSNYNIVASYNSSVAGTPLMYTIFPQELSGYPEDVNAIVYEDVLSHPTFASVNIDAKISDDGAISVTASGNVAENIMPEGEDLYLTVYLMERNVYTQDQIFWDENEELEKGGEYTHKTVIRELLTPYWGEKLEKTGGEYSMTFNTEYYEEWNKDNIYVVAFLNRSKDNHNMELNIINSAEAEFVSTGINTVVDNNVVFKVENGQIVADGEVEIYNVAGCRVENVNLTPGIYVVKVEVEGSVVTKKIVVK